MGIKFQNANDSHKVIFLINLLLMPVYCKLEESVGEIGLKYMVFPINQGIFMMSKTSIPV